MKWRQIERIALGAVLATVTASSGFAAALETPLITKGAIEFQTVALAASSTDWDYRARLDGKLVAWQCDVGGSSSNRLIKIRDLDTGETRLIGSGTNKAPETGDISGDRVVYHEWTGTNADIRMYSWANDETYTVSATAPSDETQPRIDGNLVIWYDEDQGLCYSDLDTRGRRAIPVPGAGPGVDYWDVDNGRIVWYDRGTGVFNMYTPRAPGADGPLDVGVSDLCGSLSLHGDRLVLGTYGSELYTHDIRAHLTTAVAPSVDDLKFSPTVFHDTYAWHSWPSGTGEVRIGYSRPGHSNSTIDSAEGDREASLFGHRIAYVRQDPSTSDRDVMLATGQTQLMARTYGNNRYATAANASRGYFSRAENVVLCTGENFPDALSAVPFARALEAPLLLTRRDSLPAETLGEIARLHAARIYVIGSSAAVSDAVYAQLDALSGGAMLVKRIEGVDRYETSANLALKLQDIMGDDIVFRAFFARGDTFPDALAVGPVAAGALGPVLLVKRTSVPDTIQDAVDDLNITYGYVIGSEEAVNSSVNLTLRTLITANGGVGTLTERWEGENRYKTAAEVIDHGLEGAWIDLDTLGVATGSNYPDALAGGAALGYYGSPLILTNGTYLSPAASSFLAAHEYEIGRVDVFGGANVVSSAVYDAIHTKFK